MIINKWHARLAVSAFFFLNGLCFSSWGSRIPAIQERHGLSEAGLSALLLCIPVGALLSLPFAGWLVSRTGSRPVMLAAALLYAVFLSLIGIAGSPLILGIILFAFGFIGNLGNISVNTQAVSVEVLYGQTIMSSFHATWSLAGLTGAGIGTLMVNLFITPSTHFFFISLFALAATAVAYRYTLPEPAQVNASRPPVFVKPDKALISLGIIAFCCMICEGTMYDWSGVYFVKAVEAAPGQVTMGFTAFTLATTFGRLNGDWLTRRYGITGMLRGSGLLTAAGLLLAVFLPLPIPAAIGFFLVGLGVSTVIPLVYSTAGKSTAMPQSMALAAVSTLGFLGFLAGPPIIGFIAQFAGIRYSFACIAVMGLMITFLAGKKKSPPGL
ncbi:MFS transporter [Chitinophaga sp. YIM B06452]|uniref:MFS transporter n=1 Tax=Chitinophaga sp. YIM B06452 TaxID=3082158 RepID=UPI0031FEE6B4